jgi:hypothetical protein
VVTPEQYEQQQQQQYQGYDVVTYCTAGYRSARYARQLLQQGTPARNLAGSILGWVRRGLKCRGGEGREEGGRAKLMQGENPGLGEAGALQRESWEEGKGVTGMQG